MVILPALVLSASILGIAWFCRHVIEEAERIDMDLPSLLPLLLAVLGFTLVSCFFVVAQAIRMANRIAGPTLRITTAMQRVRLGDIGFRVYLRRGSYLSEIALEFNKVLDWLNENPPEGVLTGSDVVDVYAEGLFADHNIDPEVHPDPELDLPTPGEQEGAEEQEEVF